MRVTHVITRLIVGGAQENTIASVLGLRQKPGVEVGLISGPTTGSEGSMESKFVGASEILSIVPELVRPVHPLKDFLALRKLEKIFRRQKPGIVHTHSGKAGVIGRLAARRAGVPIIIHTIHGPSFGAFQNGLSNFIFTAAERRAARVTDHFIVVADAMTTQYLAAGIGRPRQYTKVFSGFALEPFLAANNDPALRAKLGLQPDDFVVGTIARLVKLKGHDDLFTVAPELVRRCPQIKFLLVGDGEYRTRFEKLARSLKLERHFIFAGLVPPGEVPALVGIMDALVHLSLREGLPRALPQALAAAKPVVAYDCDGAREVCLENETGFLLRPGDLEGLKNRLLQLANDAALREKFGRHGQDFVRQNFSVEGMVDGIYNLYQKLAAERGLSFSLPRQTGRGPA
ncbi:MAG: glycosyltransferase family 4 protein [Verrucomicrobiales bacterium]|nr:glycosyltransferase family 4 protein [Verrucomicrobiales bacterium]